MARETFGAPGFLGLFAGLAVGAMAAWIGLARLLAARLGVGEGGAPVRSALAPVLWGAALPAAALLIDAFSFRCSAPPLAALGCGLGGLTAARHLAGLARVAYSPHAPDAKRAAAMAEHTVSSVAPGAVAYAGAGSLEEATGEAAPATSFCPLAWRRLVAGLAVLVPLLLIPFWGAPDGDEPHYLIVTHSIVSDRDLDVADDYGARVYAPYHPAALSPHYKPGVKEGSRYSMHGIGLPLLLAPAYALGARIGPGAMAALPRAMLALLYGVVAWLLFGLVAEIGGLRAAPAGTAATLLLAPLLFAPLYLFPEVPAILLALIAFRGGRARASIGGHDAAGRAGEAGPGSGSVTAAGQRSSGVGSAALVSYGFARRQLRGEWLGGAALACLPWLGVKYIPMAAALAAVGIWRAGPGRRRRALVSLAGPLAASLLLHSLFTWSLYRSLSPAAVYLGAGSQEVAPALGGDWAAYLAAWPGALATAIGYLMDQKDGLLAYGPHFLLAAAGLGWLWRRGRRDLAALLLIAMAHVGPYALSQQLSGQGPPVRPLMAVLWTLAPALGIALTLPTPRRTAAFVRGSLLALSGALTVAYASQPWLLPHDYPVKASRLLQHYTPYGSGFWRWFPQWVNVEEPQRAVTALWTLAVLAAAFLLWRWGSTAVDASDSLPATPTAGEGERVRAREGEMEGAVAADSSGDIEPDGSASGGDSPGGPADIQTGSPAEIGAQGEGARARGDAPAAAGLVPSVSGRPEGTGWQAGYATLLVLCVWALVHRVAVVRTDLMRPTTIAAGPTVWLPARLPEVAWAESGGVWVSPGPAVDFLLVSERPLAALDIDLRTLVNADVSAWVQGAAVQGMAAPGGDLRARLQLGPGRAIGSGWAYWCRVGASAGAVPADLTGGADERRLGVFFQITGPVER